MTDVKMEFNPTTYPTTAYPESERVLRLNLDFYHATSNEVYATVALDMDGNLPDDVDDMLSRKLHKRLPNAEYLGYEDVTDGCDE